MQLRMLVNKNLYRINMMNTILDNSTKALREFAYTMAAAFIVIFCILLPWIFSRAIPYWPLIIAAVLLLQAFIYPPSLIPVRKCWMKIGGVLGWINTRIILGVVFFVLLTPIGWIQRKRGKLNYHVGFDSSVQSYKTIRTQRLTAKHLETPF